MTAIAISDFLPDFGKPSWHVDETVSSFMPNEAPGRARDAAHQPEIDVEAIVRGEVERAEAEVTERLTAHHEEVLRAERESHAAEIERLQAELADAGAKIASGLTEMEARVTELATSAAARILSTLVGEDILRRSIEKLAETIRGAIRESGAVKVTVHAPLPLFERLTEQLDEYASKIHHIEAPGFDLVVDIDGSLFESRFAEWSTSLSGALS